MADNNVVPIKEELSKEDLAEQAKQKQAQAPREVDPQEIVFSFMRGQLEEQAKTSLLVEQLVKEQQTTNLLLAELVKVVKLQEQQVNAPKKAQSLNDIAQQLLKR